MTPVSSGKVSLSFAVKQLPAFLQIGYFQGSNRELVDLLAR
jgi:hypothetical protein